MRLNTKPQTFNHQVGTTYEGAPAYNQSEKMELYQSVATCLFGEDKFYETGSETITRIRNLVDSLVSKNQGLFVAKLCVYAREQLNLRTVSLALVVELSKALRKHNKSLDALRVATSRVIARADELAEIYAYSLAQFGNKKQVPQAIKKGVADAFLKFDEFQLAKYNRANDVKLRDVIRIVHPKPLTQKQADVFGRLIRDELAIPDTWETKISTQGSTTVNWQEVANNPKTGYMALLRNLRNFVKHDIDLSRVIARIQDENAVRKSKQFPFRFYTAYRELKTEAKTNARLLEALENAYDVSCQNIPDMGNVLVVVDVSGSMGGRFSKMSSVTMSEIASVMGAAIWSKTVTSGRDAMIVAFASSGEVITASRRSSALAVAKEIQGKSLGGGTSVETAWQAAQKTGFKPDTIVVFSDMQFHALGGNPYSSYSMFSGFQPSRTKGYEPQDYGITKDNTVKIAFDLRGYGANPFAETKGWYQVAGYSDKVFDLINMMQKKDEAIRLIESIDL